MKQIEYNKEVNQTIQNNLDQFFNYQIESVKRLKINLEEFIELNEEYFMDKSKEYTQASNIK